MNEYQWAITSVYVKPVEGSYTDVVVQAEWVCTVSDTTYRPFVTGISTFTTIGDPFTPYDQLTQEQILGWCWANGLDKDAVEAQVSAKLEQASKPPVVTPPLPWAATN